MILQMLTWTLMKTQPQSLHLHEAEDEGVEGGEAEGGGEVRLSYFCHHDFGVSVLHG